MVVEAEICAASSDVLIQLGFKDFTIRLNHRKVLNGLLEQAGVSSDKEADALIALDKMDKVGPEGVARELIARGVVDESAVRLMRFFEALAGAKRAAELMDLGAEASVLSYNTDVLGRLVEFIGPHEQGASGIDELQQILQLANASGTGKYIRLDPTLARGLSYYTGAIMEINVKDLSGSLGGGGRYDNLVGMFAEEEIPACGFSLGLERIIVVMTERGMFPEVFVKAPADVLVTMWSSDFANESIGLAAELRSKGLRVELYPEPDKLGKQLKFASSRGIPLVVVAGDDERAQGEVAIKDLRSGKQRRVKRNSVTEEVRQLL